MGWMRRRNKKERTWKKKLRDISIKKALAVYIVLGTAATFLAILTVQEICRNLDSAVWSKYSYGMDDYVSEWGLYAAEIWPQMDSADRLLLDLSSFLETWSPVLCAAGGVAVVSFLFYRNKLKEPLQILTDSAGRIGRNDLDFQCEYDAEDEMGKLCAGFETMRRSLVENHQKMWDMMEEQKRLNHAFAHDLRTPLTVLHGYIDFLYKYYPQGMIREEKLMDTLRMMDRQVVRLKKFGDTMKSVSTLEERKAEKKQTSGRSIAGTIKEMTDALNGTAGVKIWTECRVLPDRTLWLDEEIVCEVAENILSNSLRYAEEWVQVVMDEVGGFFELYVRDDGPGFDREGLKMAAKPYYRARDEDASEHFGIGLYICHVLCGKHGGSLAVHNSVDGGAVVSASFQASGPDGQPGGREKTS